MDWTKGYSAHWRVFEVNADTWGDAALITDVTSILIERSCDGDVPLLESGSIYLNSDIGEFEERYLRIVMDAVQEDGAERVDVATLLCSSSSGEVNRGTDNVELLGRSVLYPAEAKKVTTGTYAPKGVNGAEWSAKMLRESICAPVIVDGGFTIDENIVFDIGESYLSCVWAILNAGNYVIQISGDGTVHILEKPEQPSIILDELNAKLLHPSIQYTLDWSSVPNRFTAIEKNNVATAVNDIPSSPVSTSARGYIHDMVDKSPKRVNGESLHQFAIRRLQEESIIPDERTYTREYYPGVYPFSVARGTLASVHMDGDLRITAQSLMCDKGITVTERAQREVQLWQ